MNAGIVSRYALVFLFFVLVVSSGCSTHPVTTEPPSEMDVVSTDEHVLPSNGDAVSPTEYISLSGGDVASSDGAATLQIPDSALPPFSSRSRFPSLSLYLPEIPL